MAPARTSCVMLTRSGEWEHPCLVSGLRGKVSSYSLLIMLAVGFCRWFSIDLEKFFSTPSFLSIFIMIEYWILSNGISSVSINMIT